MYDNIKNINFLPAAYRRLLFYYFGPMTGQVRITSITIKDRRLDIRYIVETILVDYSDEYDIYTEEYPYEGDGRGFVSFRWIPNLEPKGFAKLIKSSDIEAYYWEQTYYGRSYYENRSIWMR